jgi:hypothetical protein
MIGGMIGRAVSAKAYREPAVVAAFSSWDQLLDGLDDILDRAEAQAEERASVL